MSQMSNYHYQFHTGLNLIEVHYTGAIQLSDITSYIQEILSLDLVTEGSIEYVDLSEMTNLTLDYKSANMLIGALQECVARGWQGSVYFAPRDYQFGTIRMLGAIADSLEGTFGGMMIPRREPISLAEVRDLIAQHKQIS